MTIQQKITVYAQDYYNSGLSMKEYSAKNSIRMTDLTAILRCANVLNEPADRIAVKNLIENACIISGVSVKKLAEIIEYRQADLINVLSFRRPLPKKNLILLQQYVADNQCV